MKLILVASMQLLAYLMSSAVERVVLIIGGISFSKALYKLSRVSPDFLSYSPITTRSVCIVHAGDSCIISKKMDHIKKLLNADKHFDADATFIVLEIENPTHYGIIEGDEVKNGIFKVKYAVEKPEKP